ncbi:MAG TPA: hypothetical protein VGQ24_13630, partial [Gemmatimonadales bacterium]|nr:hypothetical protein [Gemmatimonadales bacterium]
GVPIRYRVPYGLTGRPSSGGKLAQASAFFETDLVRLPRWSSWTNMDWVAAAVRRAEKSASK